MLQPFLFVGLGGSGGKTLRAIKAELTDKIELAGWDVRTQGFPAMWQFLHIDTPSYQHGEGFNARLLDPSEYLGLAYAGVSLDNIIDNIEGKDFLPGLLEEIFSPLPKKGQYRHDINHSTASYRAVGRTVAIARLISIRDRVRVSLDAIQNSAAQTKLFAEKLGVIVKEDSEPKAIIISSLSGGSGSGQFLDVCEAIKAAEPSYAWVSNQTAILYAPDVFDDPKIKQFGFVPSNNLSAINELVNGYWRANRAEPSEALYNKIGFADLPQHTSALGPRNLYLMGKSNGLATFSSQNDVYFAAASMLAKWAADSTFLDNVSAYLDSGHQFRRDGAGLMVDFHHSAPINSLGFARVSLGTDSFSNFAAQRVARSAVSQLLEGHLEGQQSGESDESLAQRTAATIFQTFLTDLNIMPPENVVELQFETTPTDSMSRYEQWALDVQDRIVYVITRYASKYGILVVIEMLRTLKEQVYDFGSAGSSETIDAISLSRNLMKDMQVNLLTPLVQELESMYGNLLAGTKDYDYAQTGENVFRSWPDGVSIPSKFSPAPNVLLLEPHTSFNAKFNQLLGYSVKVEGSEKDAMRRAVEELVTGSEHIAELRVQVADQQGAEAENRAFWSMVEIESRWWPAVLAGKPQSRWRGKFIYKLEDWEDNAKKYVRMASRPLGKFIHTTLHEWLNPESAIERQNRELRLLAEFWAIIALSKPFCQVNLTLHTAAHGGTFPDFTYFVDRFPQMSNVTANQLESFMDAAGISAGTANSYIGSSSATSIDLFSTLRSPVHHFVFDNLMKPIHELWKKSEGDASQRRAFIHMRQTRTLPETVPLAPEILDSLLRGWFVARLLGRVREDSGEIGQDPRLTVFNEDPMNSGWDALPYPLYHGEKQLRQEDYLAVVVASVGLALVNCSSEHSMKPFAPYRSLQLLGGVPTIQGLGQGYELEVSETLHNWILHGQLSSEFAPIPNPKRAGDSSMSWEERKEAVIKFFNRELQWFEDSVVNLPFGKKHDTLVWELRREVKSALQELIRMVSTLQEN